MCDHYTGNAKTSARKEHFDICIILTVIIDPYIYEATEALFARSSRQKKNAIVLNSHTRLSSKKKESETNGHYRSRVDTSSAMLI